MSSIPDAYSQWLHNERETERWLAKRPVCADCGEHVQHGHYYRINDEVICPGCMESHYREEINDFFE